MSDQIQSLNGLVNKENLVGAVTVLVEGLKATKRVRAGKGEYDEVPDQAERRKNAETLLVFGIGKPNMVANILNINNSRGDQGPAMTPEEVVAQLSEKCDLHKVVEQMRTNARHSLESKKKDGDEELIDI